jgi:hypothetical protein
MNKKCWNNRLCRCERCTKGTWVLASPPAGPNTGMLQVEQVSVGRAGLRKPAVPYEEICYRENAIVGETFHG